MKIIQSVVFIGLAISALPLLAAEDWELRRDRDSIEVFTKPVEGSRYSAVKTSTIMQDIKLASLVALIKDAEACPEWADKCAESYVYEQVSETESYIYTHNSMPFPVKDRDVLAHVRWNQDPNSLEVVMLSDAVEGMMEEIRRRVRLTEASASWRFKPLEDGSIEITNEAHINPGSALPGWVTNMLLVDTPFQTMKSFVEEVRNPKYQNAKFEFVKEPE